MNLVPHCVSINVFWFILPNLAWTLWSSTPPPPPFRLRYTFNYASYNMLHILSFDLHVVQLVTTQCYWMHFDTYIDHFVWSVQLKRKQI